MKDRYGPRLRVTLHHSVEDRLALQEVDQCDGRHAYRPALPEDDDRFRHLYAARPKAE